MTMRRSRSRGKAAVAVVAVVVLCAVAGLAVLVMSDGGGGGEGDAGNEPAGGGVDPAAHVTEERGAGEEPVTTRVPEPTPADAPTDGAPWVVIEDPPERFALVNWAELGGSLGELVPLFADVANQSLRGKFVDPETEKRVSELLIVVHEQPGLHAPDVPNVYPSEVLTRPAFAANAIAATLHARGRGLSTEQLALLTERANAAHASEQAARAREGATEWRLLRHADAYDRRSQYFADFEELLTKRQTRAMHSEVARDRMRLDPLSAAALWEGVAEIEILGDTQSMGIATANRLMANVRGTPELEQEAIRLVTARVAAIPAERLPRPGSWIDTLGYVRGDAATMWSRWCVDVVIEVLEVVSRGRLEAAPPDYLPRSIVLVWDPQS